MMTKTLAMGAMTLGVAAILLMPGTEQPAKALPSSCYLAADYVVGQSPYDGFTAAQFASGLKGTAWVTPTSVTDQAEFNQTFGTSNLRFHALGGTSFDHTNACNHSRWYDISNNNKVQGFRLFEGETSKIAGTSNISARIEAFTKITGWDGIPDVNTRYFWKGRYQIANPAQAALFQLKQNSSNDWAVMLRMDASANIYILPRGGTPVLAGNAQGKKFNLRVEEERRGTTTIVDWRMTVEIDGQSPVTHTGARDFSNAPTKVMQFRWGLYEDGATVTSSSATFGNKQPAKYARVRVAGARWGKVAL